MKRILPTLFLLTTLIAIPLAADGLRSVTMKSPGTGGSDQDVDRLLIDRDLKLVQIILRNGKTMDRHSVSDPATIHCVSGSGILTDDNGKSIALKPGVVVILPPDLNHVVKATPELSLLVTRFAEPKRPAERPAGAGRGGRRGGGGMMRPGGH